MLSDLHHIKEYFGTQTPLYLDELIDSYGKSDVDAAIADGQILTRTIYLGPDHGRVLCLIP